MAFTEIETARIEGALSDFLEARRPPENIRADFDIDFRLEGQSVVIFELRRTCHEPGPIIESLVAKATYVRGINRWKIYWQPADRKWHAYPQQPVALFFEEFLTLVEEDKDHCFWG
ncbi:MAG: DUF3024 domain-containing protein [Verrucomicrobiota bacterium]